MQYEVNRALDEALGDGNKISIDGVLLFEVLLVFVDEVQMRVRDQYDLLLTEKVELVLEYLS
jgi:hypothetical protein